MLCRRPLLLVHPRAASLRAAWSRIVIAWLLCLVVAAWAKFMETGQPSIDPELLLRILLIGYLYGITSERKLVEERKCQSKHTVDR